MPPMPVPPGVGGPPPGGPPMPPMAGFPAPGAPPAPSGPPVPQPQSAKALPVDTRGLLLVGNLSAEVSDEKVEKLLVAAIGTDGAEGGDVQWRRADPAFGFAELPTAAHAVRAAQLLNNLQLGKCTLYCCMDEKTKTQLKDWTLTKSAELAQKIQAEGYQVPEDLDTLVHGEIAQQVKAAKPAVDELAAAPDAEPLVDLEARLAKRTRDYADLVAADEQAYAVALQELAPRVAKLRKLEEDEDVADAVLEAEEEKERELASAEKEREAVAAKKAMKLRRIESKALIKKIPTDPTTLFSYAIDWGEMKDKCLLDSRVRYWLRKKVAELLGVEEPRLAEFVLRKLVSGAAAIEVINDLRPYLDDDSEEFVLKLWRLLVYEQLRMKANLLPKQDGKKAA